MNTLNILLMTDLIFKPNDSLNYDNEKGNNLSLLFKDKRDSYCSNIIDLNPRQSIVVPEFRRTDYLNISPTNKNLNKTFRPKSPKLVLENTLSPVKVKKSIHGIKKILSSRIKENALNLRSEKYLVVNSTPTNHFTCKNLGSFFGKGVRASHSKKQFCPLGLYKDINNSAISTSEDIIDTNEDAPKREEIDNKEKKGVENEDAPQDDNIIFEENADNNKDNLKQSGNKSYLSSNNSEYDIYQNIFAELKREEGNIPSKPKRKSVFDLKRAKKILDELESQQQISKEDGGCCNNNKCIMF